MRMKERQLLDRMKYSAAIWGLILVLYGAYELSSYKEKN